MGSISLNSVGHSATTQLYSDLTLTFGAGDRVGLIAANGGGKTTLLRSLAGRIEPSTGEIVHSRGLRVGFVEQDVPPALGGLSFRDAVLEALPAEERDSDSWRVEVVLDGLEAPEDMRAREVTRLSGGWQRLMLLARVWVNQPDALLLDEPTNHLDLGKVFQLERWLNAEARGMPVVIASHDRGFLDATTNRTLFLRPGVSHYFAVPYSHARAALEEADLAAQRQQERDLKEAQQLRKQAAKLTNIGINSGSDLLTIKSKQLRERAAKIENAALDLHKERNGEIRLANSGTHAKVLVAIENLVVRTPPGMPLFSIGKLHLFQGDRIVVLGRNGAGKSQFMQALRRAMTKPDSVPGIRVSPSVRLGYTDQEMSQLPRSGSPFDFIGGFRLGDQRTKALLAAAGFAIEMQDKPITGLSFGQRARLGLLALRLTEPSFYLMDEPTNHVDIAGQERLEEEILYHEASCVLVSHDRSFVKAIGTRFFEIVRGKLVETEGPEPFFRSMAENPELPGPA